MEEFSTIASAIVENGILVVIAVVFLLFVIWFFKNTNEERKLEKEERKEEKKNTNQVLQELSNSNRNIAESLNLLKTSLDANNQEYRQHDERAIKEFKDIDCKLVEITNYLKNREWFYELKRIKERLKSPVVIVQLISIIATFIVTIIPEKVEIVNNIVYFLTAIINVFAGINNPSDKDNF